MRARPSIATLSIGAGETVSQQLLLHRRRVFDDNPE
jgi:hypothetical protein